MALPVNGSTHLITALLLIYRPRKDERLSWPSWLTCSGWFTHISGHPSAAGRVQDRESSPVMDQRSTTVLRHQPSSDKTTHTHTRLTALFSGTTRVSRYQKGKTNLDFTEQETVSGSGIRWALCKSARCSRQITTPAPHHSVFYRGDALPAAQRTESKH